MKGQAMRGLIAAALVVAAATVAQAQSGGQVFRIYPVGGITPATDTSLVGAQCGLAGPPPPFVEVQNPREVWWDDPVNTGQFCRWVDTGTGPLLALPVGTQRYEATLRFLNSEGQSGPESPRSNPFWKPVPLPAAPARVIIGSGSSE